MSRSPAAGAGEPVPLALVGEHLLEGDHDIFAIVEDAGGRIVLDATEQGERAVPPAFDVARLRCDPLGELVDSYLRIPDAFRRPNAALYEWLGRAMQTRQVRGIVFRRYVWCDLWHAELERLAAQASQWARAAVDVAVALRAGADRYADAELYAAARIA